MRQFLSQLFVVGCLTLSAFAETPTSAAHRKPSVAGGVTAAVLLAQSKSNNPAPASNDNSWQMTVVWQ